MSGAVLAWRNLLQSESLTEDFDSAETSPGIAGSADNLLLPQRSRVWTGPGAAVTGSSNAVGWTWSGGKDARLIALLDHTLSASYDTANCVLQYYNGSTWSAAPSDLSTEWAGDETARHAFQIQSTYSAQGVRFVWDDPGSSTVSAGLLWISDALVLPKGVDITVPTRWERTRGSDVSLGRQLTAGSRAPATPRQVTVTISNLEAAQVFGDPADDDAPHIHDFAMYAGTSRPLLLLPASPDHLTARRRAIYGYRRGPMRLEPSGALWAVSFDVVESLP